ncbi:flavodoxin FldA [Catenovulum sp. SM1970]|uniref:flavodoxin FldA n=1 Tax=Marinifaba aquimaris TaxID=2741323 RepID=UPI001572D908|nr:flavodoxin FldA [Marinifaba aquimaris]NTS75311.1 flavodoxin FldA [Marinifaba aquimaris]
MALVGLFFGSDTGNTEAVANMIQKKLGDKMVEVMDIAKSTIEQIAEFDLLILGIPTWYYGENQCDWDELIPDFESIDFTDKLVAIFGLGDQEEYKDYFCDAMHSLYDIVDNKGAILVGQWPAEGYQFDASKALINDDTFVGLCIDEDRQPELTQNRVDKWVEQVYEEMCLVELED